MTDKSNQNKLIALALCEIRIALASKLGSSNDTDTSTKIAAHLAYALHNEALAIIEGKEFDVEEALRKVKAIDKILDEEYSNYFITKYNESNT